MKRPPNGMAQYYDWDNYDSNTNRWICSECGATRSGMIIKECQECGTYPLWHWTASRWAITKGYIKNCIYRVICRLISVLMKLRNRIDDQGYS